MKTKQGFTMAALQTGMAVTFLYFGIPLAAALFFPGYSFLSMPASLPGSDQATYPMIFNAGAILAGIATLPALLALTLWKRNDAGAIKIYLVITNLLFIALILVMSGIVDIGTRAYPGLLQRVIAVVFFPPAGVGAYFLAKRIKPSQPLN